MKTRKIFNRHDNRRQTRDIRTSENENKDKTKEKTTDSAKILNHVTDTMALNKPWLYLSICSYVVMWLSVLIGNPKLPIQFLANYGWAWHHIPEILSFLFFGTWLASMKFLSSNKLNYFDTIPFAVLTLISIYELASSHIVFWAILIIVSIPSFCGYLVIRWVNIHRSKTNRAKIEVDSFYYVAMLIACLFIGIFIKWHFSLPSFSLIPDFIILPIGCAFTVIWALSAKDLSTQAFTKVSFVFMGIYLGSIFNIFLSVDFLANPSFLPIFVDSLAVLIGLALIIRKVKKPFDKSGSASLFEKWRYVFLGVSLVSIIFAFSAFVSIVQGYLPLLPQLKIMPGGFVRFDFSLIVNIFKSLFLTGLFSFLERLLRIVEETKYK